MNSPAAHPFDRLTPDFVLAAVESRGYAADGHLLSLNSYENRVYQVGIHDADPLIAKFYRPGRWSDEQIYEEHAFCFDLTAQELPVVAPLGDSVPASLNDFEGFRVALYPQRGGRAPEFDVEENFRVMGRCLARMHNVGGTGKFEHRPAISVRSFGVESVEFVTPRFIPDDLRPAYETLTADLLRLCEERFAVCNEIRYIRVHGDCHIGNVLWRDDAPNFVDFDDARMAPAIQDLWMLVSGSQAEQQRQLGKILEGYGEFSDFDFQELILIEPLRTLRMLNYAAWLARRWDDPAFPLAFPWFNTQSYWEKHILELREQFGELSGPSWEREVVF